MTGVDRRQALALFASAPVAAVLTWTHAELEGARSHRQPGTAPRFFTEHEYETLRLLVDLILPADERSGSATDAGVPELIDFLMSDEDETERQLVMRGGLAWIDYECEKRFDRSLVRCSNDQRTSLLDEIAWPERARPEMSQGAAFFSRLRDLTATGFFTSRMGFADLDYRGNEFVTEWTGCPDEAIERLGLRRPSAR